MTKKTPRNASLCVCRQMPVIRLLGSEPCSSTSEKTGGMIPACALPRKVQKFGILKPKNCETY